MPEEGIGMGWVEGVVQVSSKIWQGCPHCSSFPKDEDVGKQINHYLKHGYKLLNVGSETSYADDGSLWHTTVAILGVSAGKLADELDGPTVILDTGG